MAGSELTLQAMRSFNPAGSIQQGQTMAMNEMKMDSAKSQQQKEKDLLSIREKAVESGYDVESHKRLLMDSGYFEEVMDIEDIQNKRITDKQTIMEKGMSVINKTAAITVQLGDAGWPALRSSLIQNGMSSEESLPVEYDDQAQKIAAGLVGNTDKLLKVLKFRSGSESQDILTKGGNIVREGKPYSTRNSGSDTRSAFEKQVDAYSQILMDSHEKLSRKDARYLAADIFIHSKEKTDIEAYAQFYQTGLRATMGDTEEAKKLAEDGLKKRQELKNVREEKFRAGSDPGSGPGKQSQKYKEGGIYKDSKGRKARYVGGKWVPVD